MDPMRAPVAAVTNSAAAAGAAAVAGAATFLPPRLKSPFLSPASAARTRPLRGNTGPGDALHGRRRRALQLQQDLGDLQSLVSSEVRGGGRQRLASGGRKDGPGPCGALEAGRGFARCRHSGLERRRRPLHSTEPAARKTRLRRRRDDARGRRGLESWRRRCGRRRRGLGLGRRSFGLYRELWGRDCRQHRRRQYRRFRRRDPGARRRRSLLIEQRAAGGGDGGAGDEEDVGREVTHRQRRVAALCLRLRCTRHLERAR
mmetsp:Transcript_29612/g.102060  ORF Transcript_29612/g.102060 Transcript_29612/m.102060 type:complete len:259 (-) Transcript_29612:106-882(-)